MCRYLDPACFMANYFSACPESSTIDFVTLRKVRDHVTQKLEDQNVVIEWTRDAVMNAMESHSTLFEIRDRTVVWRGGPSQKDRITQAFDRGFSSAFLTDLHSALKDGYDHYAHT